MGQRVSFLTDLVEEVKVEVVSDVAHGAGGEVPRGRAVPQLQLLVPRRVRTRSRRCPHAGALVKRYDRFIQGSKKWFAQHI